MPELGLAFATGHAPNPPLPLGGVGGVDAALTFALTAVGVALAPALVAVGGIDCSPSGLPTIPGMAALVLLPQAGNRLEQSTPSRP